ncbi:MAG: NAD(+)/NADH kinase [Dehalococcoidia bacterium]|nr:NAD(+)/NADH kinase [Dehalococcoidia bacterium]
MAKNNAGFIYNHLNKGAKALADRLSKIADSKGIASWVLSTAQETQARQKLTSAAVLVSVGGDGTLLRTARLALHHNIPILGVNMGKVGFMTELTIEEAASKLPFYLSGKGWIEERAVLEAGLHNNTKKDEGIGHKAVKIESPMLAVNDIVIGRAALSRVIYVEAGIDGTRYATYKGDGVIVASATGSTGYSLAAGGPILYPQSKDIIVQPISPHLSMAHPLVLPGNFVIRLRVYSDHGAAMSLDGQIELDLVSGDELTVKRSSRVVRFLRGRDSSYFYETLTKRLAIPELPFDPFGKDGTLGPHE